MAAGNLFNKYKQIFSFFSSKIQDGGQEHMLAGTHLYKQNSSFSWKFKMVARKTFWQEPI